MIKIFYFLIVATVLCFTTTSQKVDPKPKPSKINDSTLIISIKDIQTFNVMLKQGATYDQYTKLTPEATLSELVNWKIRELSDTTKKK